MLTLEAVTVMDDMVAAVEALADTLPTGVYLRLLALAEGQQERIAELELENDYPDCRHETYNASTRKYTRDCNKSVGVEVLCEDHGYEKYHSDCDEQHCSDKCDDNRVALDNIHMFAKDAEDEPLAAIDGILGELKHAHH